MLPLRGIFKGEKGESCHFVVVSDNTNSGLKIRPWIKRGITLKESCGIAHGYYFTNMIGRKLRSKYLEGGVLERITTVQKAAPNLIKSSIDVHEEYGLSRSFHRGSNSKFIKRGGSESEIDRNNRWRKQDRAGSRKAKLKMQEHYTDIVLALKSFLRYSEAL